MMIPIRCVSCGRPIAQLWENYKRRTESGEEPKKVLDELGLKNYCCRAAFLTQVDLASQLVKFKK